MHLIPSACSLLAGRCLHSIATAAARVISLRRTIVQHQLTDDECEEAGLPFGSVEAAVHTSPVPSASRWRVAAWLDHDDDPEGCLHLAALGWDAAVYYLRAKAAPVVA